MAANLTHCCSLRNVPENKVSYYKSKNIEECETCSKTGIVSCNKCMLLNKITDRFVESNVPVDFWNKGMNDFYGDPNLKNLYIEIMGDVNDFLYNGKSLFLKGAHGTGKTMLGSCLVKEISIKGFNCLYSNLFDIVNVLIYGEFKEKFEASKELKMVDFLVIDEFDPRFFGSEAGSELFGRILEMILRCRLQNHNSTMLITNNPNPTKGLGEALQSSIDSLIAGYCKEVFVTGADFRKNKA